MLTLLNLLIDLLTLFFTWGLIILLMWDVHPNFKLSYFALTADRIIPSLGSSLFPNHLEYPPCSSCYLPLWNAGLLPSPLNILKRLLLEVGFLKCIKNSRYSELMAKEGPEVMIGDGPEGDRSNRMAKQARRNRALSKRKQSA
ncbi:unnamed protein product [Microthlaspi erraticum]|uniref:Uncharacterized protein n=1 Tax=Microthlaspi erraticum TaxID=1685480 RepID=A0A6D2K7H2_9BRAS|nr:unnamed protein product [Microthlaspi erraticum]